MGGQNSQDSTLERRSLIWNDDNIEDGTVPANIYQAETGKGKFFTRGCRGNLQSLQIYCIGDGADTITLRYSPHPCIGPFHEEVLTPAAAWAWQNINLLPMWNYDSLFIWVSACEANVDWAYDTELPYDGHEMAGGGSEWWPLNIRPFIRAVMTGETPGDVPVSGIVNVIRLPNATLEAAMDTVLAVPNAAWRDICYTDGAGELVQVEAEFDSAVVPAAGVEYRIRITADVFGGLVINNRQLTQSVIATSGRCALGEFIQTATTTYMWVRLPIQYRRRLEVSAYQTTGAAVDVTAIITANELG